jgi:protein CpxP
MKMLNVLLVGIALFAGLSSASAQEKSKKTPEQRAELHTERLTKELGLSADQRTKIAEFNLGVALKNESIRNNSNIPQETKISSLKSNNEARKMMIKTILTEEQIKKFEELEAKKDANKADDAQKKETKSSKDPVLEEL